MLPTLIALSNDGVTVLNIFGLSLDFDYQFPGARAYRTRKPEQFLRADGKKSASISIKQVMRLFKT